MAIRTNMVEYVGTARNTQLDASTTEEQTVTVDIPENSTRTFLSVWIEVTAIDNNSATSSRGSMTARTVGVGIDSVADDDATITDTISDGTDQAAFVFKRDVTSYFTTNFTGTSHTVGMRFSFTQTGTNALSLIHVCMKLFVTYSYDDSAQTTRIKTVRIPIQCGTASSGPTTETEIGTNQIPDLSSFLPESTKTYKDIWFEIEQYTGTNTTTDIVLSMKTASDTQHDITMEQANNTPLRYRYLWKRTNLTTNAAQAFKLWSNPAVNGQFSCLLCVTYTYDHSASNDQIASLIVPMRMQGRTVGGGVTTESAVTFSIGEVWIEEPATITMLQSAVQVFRSEGTGHSPHYVRVKGQIDWVQYSTSLGSYNSGAPVLTHRIDSGATYGAPFTLGRGRNVFVVDSATYSNGNTVWFALILNYKHGKHSSGSGVCNHTIKRLLKGDHADDQNASLSSISIPISETNYWINGYGIEFEQCQSVTTATSAWLRVQSATGDPLVGARDLIPPNTALTPGTDPMICREVASVADAFWRFASDPYINRLNPKTARTWYVQVSNSQYQLVDILTYHAITFDKTSAVTGSGGGSVALDLHFAGTDSYTLAKGEKVASFSRTGNGNVTITWYDDTENVLVSAREDGAHIGRSDRFRMA